MRNIMTDRLTSCLLEFGLQCLLTAAHASVVNIDGRVVSVAGQHPVVRLTQIQLPAAPKINKQIDGQ